MMTLANPAFAFCGGYEGTFLSCQVEGNHKTLAVCFDDEVASYRFGYIDGPVELELNAPIATLDYTPWPGAGSTIWEEVKFINQNYSYTVAVGLMRDFPASNEAAIGERYFGGVVVHRDSVEIANLTCDPETIYINTFEGLTSVKNMLGYVWNVSDRAWVELPD